MNLDEWAKESSRLYEVLNNATESYNQTELEYQMNKQDIRVEMHDDKTLIKELEDSLIEGDVILASLQHKAKFSKKLEEERRRMLEDRSKLLKDLCSDEKLKYHKKLNTLPSFIEIPHEKNNVVDNIASKIRHKLFKGNGQMRKQSPDNYTRRESHVQQEFRIQTSRNLQNPYTDKQNKKKSSNSTDAFYRNSNKFQNSASANTLGTIKHMKDLR